MARTGRPPARLGPRLRRVLAMLPWLLDRGEVPLGEVAERFGLTDEEALADLAVVGAFGIDERVGLDRLEVDLWDDDEGSPVVHAFRGALLAAPPRLSDAQTFAVLAAARALLAVPGADPDGALARVATKLEAALGDDAPLEVELAPPPLLAEVQGAMADRARLRIDYWSGYRDAVGTRAIDPLAVYSLRGRWYLLAHDLDRDLERRFRVDRIRSLQRTGEPAEHDPVEPPTEAFSPPDGSATVTLVVEEGARWILEAYEPLDAEDLGDGRWRVRFSLVGERWLERLLLRAGDAVTVEAPPELADLRRRSARRLLARYR